MSEVKSWKEGSSGEPKFPNDFDVVKKATLQVTDIATNKNKYYAIELHSAKNKFRVYTHYGRTDDLDSNPDAGVRESRYLSSLLEAEAIYDKIYKEKTSARKGYKELSLASSKIGSKKTLGSSSGEIDEKTIKKMASTSDVQIVIPTVTIHKEVQILVNHLYDEATKTLTKKVNASITANGIETPLGVLTMGQIDKGDSFLEEIAFALSKKKSQIDLSKLSGEFYTVIPHKIGRTKADVLDSIINDIAKIKEKQDTLQLMRDMLNVSGKGKNVLLNPEVEKKYTALGCEIDHISKNSDSFKEIHEYVKKTALHRSFTIKNIFSIKRANEYDNFTKDVSNHKLLFHGSGAHNWVGILSRGLMLPKQVTKLGVTRTDAGWLGHGIYFGDCIDTAMNYARSGRLNSTFITLAKVALGEIKVYNKITYGLESPPKGYHSCHGKPGGGSQFSDNEFVVYDTKQQRLEYLLEL